MPPISLSFSGAAGVTGSGLLLSSVGFEGSVSDLCFEASFELSSVGFEGSVSELCFEASFELSSVGFEGSVSELCFEASSELQPAEISPITEFSAEAALLF